MLCVDSPTGEVPDAPRHRGEQQRPSSARTTPRTKVCVCVCCVCVCVRVCVCVCVLVVCMCDFSEDEHLMDYT